MKKILLSVILLIGLRLGMDAQVIGQKPGYIPHHLSFLEHPEALQQGLSPIPYGAISMRHDSYNNGTFTTTDSTIHFYNSTGNVDTSFGLLFFNLAWKLDTREIHLAKSGRDTAVVRQQITGSTFNNVQRLLYVYNDSGNINNKIYQNWNNGAWDTLFGYQTGYINLIKVLDVRYQVYDNSNGPFWRLMVDTAYISSSKLSSVFVVATYDTIAAGNLIATHKINLTYNTFHTLISKQDSILKTGTSSTYLPYSKTAYVYSQGSGSLQSIIDSTWNSGSSKFLAVRKQDFNKNTDGNDTMYLSSNWDGTNSRWVLNHQYNYQYDNGGNIIFEEYIGYVYNISNNSLNVSGKDRYYYTYTPANFSSIAEPGKGLDVKLYPNPTTGTSVLGFTLETPATMDVQVYDMTGKIVWSQSRTCNSGSNTIPLNAANLTNGIYMVQLKNRTDGSIDVSKLIKN